MASALAACVCWLQRNSSSSSFHLPGTPLGPSTLRFMLVVQHRSRGRRQRLVGRCKHESSWYLFPNHDTREQSLKMRKRENGFI